MATQGRGDYPFRSAWLLQRARRRLGAIPAKPITTGGNASAQPAVLRDWLFESSQGAIDAVGKSTVAFAGRDYTSITFVSDSSTTYASRTNTTITAPASIQDGDFLLLTIVLGVAGGAPDPSSVPAGFTEIGSVISVNDGSFFVKFRSYYKQASSESGNYTVNHTAASSQGLIQVFRGVDWTSGPFSGTQTENNGTGVTRTWTGLLADTNKTMLVAHGFDWGVTSNNLTPPSGMTESEEVNPLIYAAYEEVNGGNTGNRSHSSNSSATGPWGARLIPLRPQEVGGSGIASGALSSAGVAASSLIGAQTQAGAKSSAGIATTALAGSNINAGALSSSGVAAANIAGGFLQSGALSSTGAAVASLAGSERASGALSASGVADSALIGSALGGAEGAISASGVATVAFTGAKTDAGALSSSGVADAAIAGAQTQSGVLAAAGAASTGLVGDVAGAAAVGALSAVAGASVSFVGSSVSAAYGRSGKGGGKYRTWRQIVIEEAERVDDRAERLSEALRNDEISQADARKLEQDATALRAMLAASVYDQIYISRTAQALVAAIGHAASIKDERARAEQVRIAAALAAQIEADIEDEDETLLLLSA